MEIRRATPEDVPQVLPMVRSLAAFLEARDPAKYALPPGSDVGERYRDWLVRRAKDDRSVFLVADTGNASAGACLVAFLVATVEPDIPIYRVREYGFIHDVWVEPDYRNEGLARQLVTLALERFREIGVPQVRLDVLVDNQPAQELFKQCGFRPSICEMLVEVQQP